MLDFIKKHNGHLMIGSFTAKQLADRFGTPLYVVDEKHVRHQARMFKDSFTHPNLKSEVIYASKAFLTLAMCKLIQEEGLSLDVVSGGELYTAHMAGFDMERIYFHGNNKSMDELKMAIEFGVGTIVLDNENELQLLLSLLNKPQKVLLRVNPGIEAHTHEYIATTKNDSKFGLSTADPATMTLIEHLEQEPMIDFVGLHAHIGSQIFEAESFYKEADTLIKFISDHRLNIAELNLGGGFGVSYTLEDQPLTLSEFLHSLLDHIFRTLTDYQLPTMKIMIEPGRSIVANAGTTLYTVGSTKTTINQKNYVFVDGSMADHIRTVLYDAQYTALIADRVDDPCNTQYTVTGKACESGDIIIKKAHLPVCNPGDILAVLSTGAYHYTMSSNYNRLLRPAVIFVHDDQVRIVVKRETYEDLIRNDIGE
ncbi:MAG: diaminopimelate decarboxylase [Firmicutes bacterium HGW-Firmicutes-19]|nr:MAG: diaminopimelate decarboxylase [Firmicutes bacterium HGW-Firmicutes-19]